MKFRFKNIENILPFLKENKKTVLVLFVVAIFADILFKKTSVDFLIFSALLLYGIFIKIFRIKSSLTFLLCIGLLVVMSINYLFTGTSISTEKAAVWLVLFLAVGIVQQWKE